MGSVDTTVLGSRRSSCVVCQAGKRSPVRALLDTGASVPLIKQQPNGGVPMRRVTLRSYPGTEGRGGKRYHYIRQDTPCLDVSYNV